MKPNISHKIILFIISIIVCGPIGSVLGSILFCISGSLGFVDIGGSLTAKEILKALVYMAPFSLVILLPFNIIFSLIFSHYAESLIDFSHISRREYFNVCFTGGIVGAVIALFPLYVKFPILIPIGLITGVVCSYLLLFFGKHVLG